MLVCEKWLEFPDVRHTCKSCRFGTMVRSFSPYVKTGTMNFVLRVNVLATQIQQEAIRLPMFYSKRNLVICRGIADITKKPGRASGVTRLNYIPDAWIH